jgi:transposase-like protein
MRGQYPKEFRERAVRLVTESLDEHGMQWSTIAQVATRLGVGPGVASVASPSRSQRWGSPLRSRI